MTRPQLFDLSLESLAYRSTVAPHVSYLSPEDMGYINTGARWLTEAQLRDESGPCQVVTPARSTRSATGQRKRINRLLANSPADRRGRAARKLLTRQTLEHLYVQGMSNRGIAAWATQHIGHIGRGDVSSTLVCKIARELGLDPRRLVAREEVSP